LPLGFISGCHANAKMKMIRVQRSVDLSKWLLNEEFDYGVYRVVRIVRSIIYCSNMAKSNLEQQSIISAYTEYNFRPGSNATRIMFVFGIKFYFCTYLIML
jgi:hypothetical protein